MATPDHKATGPNPETRAKGTRTRAGRPATTPPPAILQAAKRLFLEAGLDGVNLERVGEAAGVTRQTAYNLLGSKEAVFRAMVGLHCWATRPLTGCWHGWARHFDRGKDGQDGGARLRPVQGRGPGDRLESPYDAEAWFRTKANTTWTGYMVHFTQTCDAGAPRLVVHADTTPANVHDALRTAPIRACLAAKDLAPSEHLVDSAYVSADHLISAREKHGIDLVGPSPPD